MGRQFTHGPIGHRFLKKVFSKTCQDITPKSYVRIHIPEPRKIC
jgi:hypothetical protein